MKTKVIVNNWLFNGMNGALSITERIASLTIIKWNQLDHNTDTTKKPQSINLCKHQGGGGDDNLGL